MYRNRCFVFCFVFVMIPIIMFFSLSRIVFEIFDFKVLRYDHDLWPLKVNLGQILFYHSKANIWLLFDYYGHHLSISYRFQDIRFQSFQGLTLTFDHKRSSGVKKIIPYDSSYMTSYLTSMGTISLSRTGQNFKGQIKWRIWPLKVEVKNQIFAILEREHPLTKRRGFIYCA